VLADGGVEQRAEVEAEAGAGALVREGQIDDARDQRRSQELDVVLEGAAVDAVVTVAVGGGGGAGAVARLLAGERWGLLLADRQRARREGPEVVRQRIDAVDAQVGAGVAVADQRDHARAERLHDDVRLAPAQERAAPPEEEVG